MYSITVIKFHYIFITTYEGKWKHGQTRTIRVPIALADRVLTLARQLDNNKSLDTSEKIKAATLLNHLKAKRKKSKCDLADVEAILDMLSQSPADSHRSGSKTTSITSYV